MPWVKSVQQSVTRSRTALPGPLTDVQRYALPFRLVYTSPTVKTGFLLMLCCSFLVGSSSQRRDNSDLVGVLVKNNKLSVRLLFYDQPILRGEPSLPEPDLLVSGWFFASPQHNRLLSLFIFREWCAMLYVIYG